MGDGMTKEKMQEKLNEYDRNYAELMAKYLELRAIISLIGKIVDVKEI